MPLRIALISVVFSVMWIPYHLVLRASGGLKHHKSPNLSKLEGSFVRWYFWMLCRAIGLSPKFEGKRLILGILKCQVTTVNESAFEIFQGRHVDQKSQGL